MNKLAIVIPGYRGEFLSKSLSSLAQQTNKNFNVYLGDDCSPDRLDLICAEFTDQINLVYHRFESNLGGKDLVAHWERCVGLIKNESWIWIFSDDDIAEPACVEAFYDALDKTGAFFDVYRFNTSVIDQNDLFLSAANESPIVEDAVTLAYFILMGQRGNSMPDHIFKRSAYIKNGGVVNFIQAQASDWATSIKFALGKGLYSIPGPRVKWRFSGKNISSIAYKSRSQLIFGHLQFIEWVNNVFGNEHEVNSVFKLNDIRDASLKNLQSVITYHYHGIPYKALLSIVYRIKYIFTFSFYESLMFCLKINFNIKRANVNVMKYNLKRKIKNLLK